MPNRHSEAAASVPDGVDELPLLSQLLQTFAGRSLTAVESVRLENGCREVGEVGGAETPRHGAVLSTTPLSLDALVLVSQLLQSSLGRPMAPEESSRLKHAYQVAKKDEGGATLQTVIEALERHRQEEIENAHHHSAVDIEN